MYCGGGYTRVLYAVIIFLRPPFWYCGTDHPVVRFDGNETDIHSPAVLTSPPCSAETAGALGGANLLT